MNTNNHSDLKKTEIDLREYLAILIKHRMIFIGTLLCVFLLGLTWSLVVPNVYRAAATIQFSVSGETLPKAEDVEYAQKLKALIMNGAFNDTLNKRLGLDPRGNRLEFDVAIPDKSNILHVSIDTKKNDNISGEDVLRELCNLIPKDQSGLDDITMAGMISDIRSREAYLVRSGEALAAMERQIEEIMKREDALRTEAKNLNLEIARMSSDTKPEAPGLIKKALQRSDYISDQLRELSAQKERTYHQIRVLAYQINECLIIVSKHKKFFPRLKILSQPRVYRQPIGATQKKILFSMVNLGLFLAAAAVFLLELWKRSKK
jgi:uncharacterized protein involved in exopolysaccharide biosynthesis